MRDALLRKIFDSMHDEKIFFVTADFGSPVIDEIKKFYPDRFTNVGIAEQNLINISAGLALEGFKVFAYAIAPFLTMRCYEQIRVNLCLLGQVRPLNVNLVGVGAGYSYVVSGPTHQCYEDISIMRTLPPIEIYSPSDDISAAEVFSKCTNPGIRYIRLDAQVVPRQDRTTAQIRTINYCQYFVEEVHVCLIATGFMTNTALSIANELKKRNIETAVIDLVNLSEKFESSVLETISKAQLIVSLEEGFIGRGGLDALVNENLRHFKIRIPHLPLGVEPRYSFELGTRLQLHEEIGLSTEKCVTKIKRYLEEEV